MMRNIYLLKDILFRRKALFFISIALLFFVNILLFTVIRSIYSVSENMLSLRQFSKQTVYVGNDQSTAEENDSLFSENTLNNSNELAHEVVDYLQTNYSYAINWVIDSPYLKQDENNITFRSIDQSSLTMFSMDIMDGQSFTSKGFLESTTNIPVLVGSALSENYPVGTVFHTINPTNEKEESYEVTGVLQDNSFVSSLYAIDSKDYLNYSVIRPITDADKKTINITELVLGLQDLLVFGEDKKGVQNLSSYLKKKLNYTIKFYPQTENFEDFFSQYKAGVAILIGIGILFLGGTIVLIVWNVYISYQLMIREITIRMMVGLSAKTFQRALLISQLCLGMVSIIPVYFYALSMRVVINKSNMTSFKTMNYLGLATMDSVSILILAGIIISTMMISAWTINRKVSKISISLRVLE